VLAAALADRRPKFRALGASRRLLAKKSREAAHGERAAKLASISQRCSFKDGTHGFEQ
jgi:hypothetical protein